MTITDEETVARFVLRARRVEAHSLVQDRETFAAAQQERFTVRLTAEGTGTFSRPLPADEEVFESLAARVRPLTLASEPIYYDKVLDAMRRLLEAAPSATEQQREQLDELSRVWTATTLGQQVQAYAMRGANADGTNPTDLVSDTQLAAGWMYADLVHADAKGWKEKALAFSLQERYAAAATVFSRIAALTVTTLQFVEQLHRAGVVVVDEQVWEDDVVVDVAEIVYEGTVYTAAPDTQMPELHEPLGQHGGPWTQLTITEHLRHNPANQVRVELAHADGSLLAAHDAAVMHRSRDGDVLHWHALVANSLIFRVQVRAEGDDVAPLSIDVIHAGEDHRTTLAANTFQLQINQAHTLTFRVQNEVLLQYAPESLEPAVLLRLQAATELLEDVVGLEDLTGHVMGPFTREVTGFERVRLRQTHMLWQGKVVEWDRSLPPLVSPAGVVPRAVKIDPTVFDAGGVKVPTPEVLIGHPQATWHDQGFQPDAGPDARTFTVTLPDQTRFLAWSPPARSTSSDDEPLAGEAWGLTGIDQDACPF